MRTSPSNAVEYLARRAAYRWGCFSFIFGVFAGLLVWGVLLFALYLLGGGTL